MNTKTLRNLSLAVGTTAFLVGCNGLGKMVKKQATFSYDVKPNPLEMHGDSVGFTVTGKYPAKVFAKKATVTLTPVVKFAGGEKAMKPVILCTFLAATLVFVSCADNKKTGKQSALARAYHNVTGHYNYFFNAREIIHKSQKKLDDSYKDNYNKVLEMYRYAAVESAQAESTSLDDAIKRATVNVTLHRKSDWADDSYLYIGMGQYLKKDYKEAEATFGFMINEFDPKKLPQSSKKKQESTTKTPAKATPKNTKKKTTTKNSSNKSSSNNKSSSSNKSSSNNKNPTSKEPKNPASKNEEPKNQEPKNQASKEQESKEPKVALDKNGKKIKRRTYFFKHRPVREDAMLWLARTYIEQARYDEADTWIFRLKNDPTLPKVLLYQIPAIESYCALRQKNYTVAIERLEATIKRVHRRSERTRGISGRRWEPVCLPRADLW